MKYLFVILVCFPFVVHAEELPRTCMKNGIKAYESGEYTNAVHLLEKTVLAFPYLGNYNLGNAYYRQKKYEKAAQVFSEVLRSPDLSLQAKAYYNRANALFIQATLSTRPAEMNRAIEFAFQAEDAYEKSILLNPNDFEAKQNFERARALRIELIFKKGKWFFDQAAGQLKQFKAKKAKQYYLEAKREFSQLLANIDPKNSSAKSYLKNTNQQLEMLQKAVEETQLNLDKSLLFIKDFQYSLAARILGQLTVQQRYAFDLEPDLKKKYEETIKKNRDVLKIIKDLSNKNQIR